MSTMTAVKERPILFSAPMVRAILSGAKTQTRRVVKPGPPPCQTGPDAMYSYRHGWRYGGVDYACERDLEVCPHGTPGDRLWVRETFMHRKAEYEYSISTSVPYLKAETLYAADVKGGVKGAGFTPGIFMPRWASRITLELTDVRVQRVQEISEEDACAEGVERHHLHVGHWKGYPEGTNGWTTPSRSFRSLWDSINAKRVKVKGVACSFMDIPSNHPYSWKSNPWVFALTFRRLP